MADNIKLTADIAYLRNKLVYRIDKIKLGR